jgi:hypothetical protein
MDKTKTPQPRPQPQPSPKPQRPPNRPLREGREGSPQKPLRPNNRVVRRVLVLLRYVKVDGFVCELRCHNTRTLRSR